MGFKVYFFLYFSFILFLLLVYKPVKIYKKGKNVKIAITGSKGLLGSSLKKLLKNKGYELVLGDRPDFNIASYESMMRLLSSDIDLLINCAAFTDVKKAEEEKKQAYLVNAQAAGILSRVCLEYNIHLIHFSTDFVFNGESETPYVETDSPKPLNYYGLSKLHGERAIQKKLKKQLNYTIFRVQWLYGNNTKNFFFKILEAAKQGTSLNITSDEIGSPCSANYISNIIYRILSNKYLPKIKGKIIHLTHNDSCSRYQCGKYFLDKMGYPKSVTPIENQPLDKVIRPKKVVLDNTYLNTLLKGHLGTWKKDLDNYINEIR